MQINRVSTGFNLKSFKAAPALNDDFSHASVPEIKKDSLELLSNYSKGGLALSFGAGFRSSKSPLENRDEFIKFLSQNKRMKPSAKDEIAALCSGSDKTGKIKRELVFGLSKNENFSANTIINMLINMSPSASVASIQKDLALKLAKKDKFSAENINHIVSRFSRDSKKMAEDKMDFIFKAAQNRNFTGSDTENAITSICDREEQAKAQIDFINKFDKTGFLNNKNITDSFDLIIRNIKTHDDVKKTIKQIKYFASKGFFENEILKRTPHSVYDLLKYTQKRPKADIEEIFSYMEQINFKKLAGEEAPLIKSFNFNQYLTFADYHLRHGGETDFNSEDLTFDEDLTEFLSFNYTNGDSLTDILSTFPATNRNVGYVPKTWLDKIPKEKKEEAVEKIYDAISDFQKNKDCGNFSANLSKILRKRVHVDKISNGGYGTVFRISVPNAYDACLKIFDRTKVDSTSPQYNIHGQHYEVQIGLLANTYSNDFVRMYFGRVSPGDSKDGFIVTQFLDNNTRIDSPRTEKGTLYSLDSQDKFANTIKGKIIDYGKVIVKNSYSERRERSYKLF